VAVVGGTEVGVVVVDDEAVAETTNQVPPTP